MGTELELEPASKQTESASKQNRKPVGKQTQTGQQAKPKTGWQPNWNRPTSKIGNRLTSKLESAGKQTGTKTGKQIGTGWQRNREANRDWPATKPEAVGDGFGDQVEPATRRDWIMQRTKVK